MLNAACEQCRLRKVRCDGLEPCTPCIRLGRKQECFRRSRKKRTTRSHSSQDPSTKTEQSERFFSDTQNLIKGEAEGSMTARRKSASPFWPFEGVQHTVNATEQRAASHQPLDGLALIEQARYLLIDEHMAKDVIIYLYHWRVSSAVHSCVFVPHVLRSLRRVFSGDEDDTFPEVEIAILLMVVASGLRSMPRVNVMLPGRLRARFDTIRNTYTSPNRAREIAHVARTVLLNHVNTDGRSLSHIQLVCLLLAFDTDGGNSNEQLFDHAVRTMRKWPFDRFNAVVGSSTDVDHEMTVRCWWYLVCRDWLGAVSTGSYSIQPSHFACRLPFEITDAELDRHHATAPLHSAMTTAYLPVRYSLTVIQFAMMVRRLIDLRIAKSLDLPSYSNEVMREFEAFFANLPDAYSLQRSRAFPYLVDDRARAVDAKTTTERWLIHQQCFYTLVELSGPISLLAPSRIAIPLAQHILDTRQDVESLCSVTDFFRFKTTNAVNACVLLLLHLMQAQRDGNLTFISRDIMLGRVRRAINGSKDLSTSHVEAFALVTELLKIEAQAWSAHPIAAPSYEMSNAGVAPTPLRDSATARVLDESFPPLSASSDVSQMSSHGNTKDSRADSQSASASLSSISTPSEIAQQDAAFQLDYRKDPEWLAALPSDNAVSPLFQPPPVDPNGSRFYDAIRSTLLWSESSDVLAS